MTFQTLRASLMMLMLWASVSWAGPVNINTADAETLSAELNGVGMSRALAIVEYRERHGPFASADDLAKVTGIGQRTIELNRQFILVEPAKARRSK